MSLRVLELLVAVAVAYGFHGAGQLILYRRSHSLRNANFAFLTGLSAAALVLFPLSLIAGRHTLGLIAGAVCVSVTVQLIDAAVLFGRRKRAVEARPRQRSHPAPDGRLPRDWVVIVAGLVLTACVLQFSVLNLRVSYFWDGYQIWGTKALLLYDRGALTRDFLVPGEPERLSDYPPLLPLFHAVTAVGMGEFEWNSLKPNYLVFFLSLLISTYALAAALLTRRLAWVATALAAAIPEVSTRSAVGGYADMPQAALVSAAAAALFVPTGGASFRHPLPWLIAGTLMVKSEGTILAVIAVVCLLVFRRASGVAESVGTMRRHAAALLLVGGAFAVRRAYVWWVDSKDAMFGPMDAAHLQRAVTVLDEVLRTCASHMLNIGTWGALWPAFLAGSALLLAAGTRIERGLCLATVAAVSADVAIFCFTNWNPVSFHIEQAFDRLLIHVAPVALVLTVCAWARLARLGR